MTTQAAKVVNMPGRSLKDKAQMCDFFKLSLDCSPGDVEVYTMKDGSQVMLRFDENLQPLELIEV